VVTPRSLFVRAGVNRIQKSGEFLGRVLLVMIGEITHQKCLVKKPPMNNPEKILRGKYTYIAFECHRIRHHDPDEDSDPPRERRGIA
jgi:hypothetical protein